MNPRTEAEVRVAALEAGLWLLLDDLGKARPEHFSLGLMRLRVKELLTRDGTR